MLSLRPLRCLSIKKKGAAELVTHGQVATGHFSVKPPADQQVDNRFGKRNRQFPVTGFELVQDKPVELVGKSVEEIKQKRACQQFAVTMAIAGEGRPAVFFEPTDMPANLSKRFPEPLLVGFAWKKAGNLYVHAASAVTERIGVNRLVDQGEEMSFGCGELFHWKPIENRFEMR
jgi:hypothetical protein